ncbi:MAG: response regulator [Campylobacterota bacterium]|nr:response regulator [Campylobacterota bacterium]
MNKIQELSLLSKNYTILYVEDSISLLKQMNLYFEKLFKNVYISQNGQEGLEKYKQHIPDIVLTDLNMPKMNGFDMIKTLKEINPNVKIIIISAYIDTGTLLEAMHLGVSDFIPKPIDRELLSDALLKILIEINQADKTLDKDVIDKEKSLIKKLTILGGSNTSIELINHYKGVPLIHNGTIVSKSDSNIIIHAPYIQTLAMAYEKYTVISSEYLDHSIEANIHYIDTKTREIILDNLKESTDNAKSRKQVRIKPDRYFKAIIHKGNKRVDAEILDLSSSSISVLLDKNIMSLDTKEDIDLNLGFNIHHKGGSVIFVDSTRISTKAVVFKIIEHLGKIELILLYELNKSKEELLVKYIVERELELIKEFKKLKLEDLL